MKTNPQTILLSGCSRGLGSELAHLFCQKGHTVYGIIRNPASLPTWTKQFSDCFYPVVGDITTETLSETITQALSSVDTLDIIINNAGIVGAGAQLAEVDIANLRQSIDVHCIGALRCTQAALPFLLRSSRPLILNISSRLGSLTKVSSGGLDHLLISYAGRIAKASQNMLTACLQRELCPQGVGVFAVHPGRLQTAMANPDADLSALQGAQRIIHWIETRPKDVLHGYFEPTVGELPW